VAREKLFRSRQDHFLRILLLGMFTAILFAFVVNVNDGTFLKSIILIVFTAALAAVAATNSLAVSRLELSFSSLHILFLLYLGASALSITYAVNIRLSLEAILTLLCYYCVFHFSLRYLDTRQTVDTLVVVTVLACLVALSYHLVPESSSLFQVLQQVSQSSTFGNRTYFAGYLVLMLPILISRIINDKSGFLRRNLSIVATILVLFLMVKTESRSAWAAGLVSVVLFVVLNFRASKSRWMAIALIALLAIGSFLMFHELISRRLTGMFELNPQSAIARRLYFYEGAWRAFLASPIIGNGVGNFIVFLPGFRSPDYWMLKSEDIVPHAHNEYLEILSETGLVGLLLFGTFVVYYFRKVVAAYKRAGPTQRTLMAGFIAAIAGVLIDNLSSLNLRTVPVALSFYMIIGLALKQTDLQVKTFSIAIPPASRKFRFVPWLVWLAFIVWISPRILHRYNAERQYLSGIILDHQDRQLEASRSFSDAIENYPRLAEARLYLAANQVEQARYGEAREQAKMILAEYPYYPKARTLLAISAYELGDSVLAMKAITEEMAIENSPQVYFFAAGFCRSSRQPEKEYVLIKTQLEKNIQSGMPDYALQALERLRELCFTLHKSEECVVLLNGLREKFYADSLIIRAVRDADAAIARGGTGP
jgi:O-antigen ligase